MNKKLLPLASPPPPAFVILLLALVLILNLSTPLITKITRLQCCIFSFSPVVVSFLPLTYKNGKFLITQVQIRRLRKSIFILKVMLSFHVNFYVWFGTKMLVDNIFICWRIYCLLGISYLLAVFLFGILDNIYCFKLV